MRWKSYGRWQNFDKGKIICRSSLTELKGVFILISLEHQLFTSMTGTKPMVWWSKSDCPNPRPYMISNFPIVTQPVCFKIIKVNQQQN